MRRYDADDGLKHMGLMLLAGKNSDKYKNIKSVTYQKAKRKNTLQIQGLIVKFSYSLNVGFIYCRSTPSNSEVQSICENFLECNILMGDFNLSHRNKEDLPKVSKLCHPNKINVLNEITRPLSNNQLDYIFVDKVMNDHIFVTSYNNFISDHKSIIFRLGLDQNKITKEMKGRINFDSESHLKSREDDYLEEPNRKMTIEDNQQETSFNDDFEDVANSSTDDDGQEQVYPIVINTFNRKFNNPDMATCWLNSCLQFILIAMDYDKDNLTFDSELGVELLRLHRINQDISLDPSVVKDIIVSTEDTRIATRLSRLDPNDHEHRRFIEDSRYDLKTGQQCVRDFFLCLNENVLDWPDVSSLFSFLLTHSSKCDSCGNENTSETSQMNLILDVPPDGSDLKIHVENYLNEGWSNLYFCEENCKKLTQKHKKIMLTCAAEAEFLTVFLSRTLETIEGYKFVRNQVNATSNINIRYSFYLE